MKESEPKPKVSIRDLFFSNELLPVAEIFSREAMFVPHCKFLGAFPAIGGLFISTAGDESQPKEARTVYLIPSNIPISPEILENICTHVGSAWCGSGMVHVYVSHGASCTPPELEEMEMPTPEELAKAMAEHAQAMGFKVQVQKITTQPENPYGF